MLSFSDSLQSKLDILNSRKQSCRLGELDFSSRILLAPMASICNAPFRLLMQQLGAGGSASELVSCDGIIHGNKRTLDMLRIHPKEKHLGIQLFGEDKDIMAQAAKTALEYRPDFIDINMGCPVRKVVNKGGGSALLKDAASLGPYLETVKKSLGSTPLTIKIRTGWDDDQINAHEIVHIAKESGVNMVAIHGRTRAQQYRGSANWDYIEWLAEESSLPLIGNGDLHQAFQVKERLDKTKCQAVMVARGCLRNPFIFLEPYTLESEDLKFTSADYFEVLSRYAYYVGEFFDREQVHLIQVRKLMMWFAAGFPGASIFRSKLFDFKTLEDAMKWSEDFFQSNASRTKFINYGQDFMMSGHG